MKTIIFIMAACAAMVACGDKNVKESSAGQTNVEVSAETKDSHLHEADTHMHDDGALCEGNHDEHIKDTNHVNHDVFDDHRHAALTDDHDHMEEVQENPDEIVFSKAQAARSDFAVQPVTLGLFHEVIRTSGQILPALGDEVTLVAPLAGVVSFADNKLAEGVRVNADRTLFYVSSKNIVSGDALVRDANAYRKAKADLDRAEKLLKDRIVSQAEYDALKAAYEDAKNSYEALAETATEQGAAIKPSISGYVTSLYVSEGDYVEAGTQLAAISQNRRLVLRAEVSQRYLKRLPNIVSANFIMPYDDDTVWQLDELDGRLLSSGRNVVQGTPLIPVTFEFNNNGQIIPGSYVDVMLIGAPEENVLTVPITAISEQQGLYYVYIQLDEECYMRREVTLGADDGINVEILSGLQPGERVVVRGAVNLKMASASGAIPHGHEH